MTAAGLAIIIARMVTGITLMGHGIRPMEMGRRHGLGDRALEYAGLPNPERRERLEYLMDFIHEANDRRVRQGENPNTFQDLRREYDLRQAKG